jgi:hypothetical protein
MRSIASLFAATVFAAGLVALATPASALTSVPAKPAVTASTDLQPVGWRCGRGRHMNRWGRCVRNGRW